MSINRVLAGIMIIISLCSCAGMKPIAFQKAGGNAEPLKFFIGKTNSYGVIENAAGRPTAQITTNTTGILKDGIINIEQDLFPEGSKANHRSWTLKQIDEHHVDATANDIDGTAHGLLYGNRFTWTFRLKLSQRNFIKHLRMQQNMYFSPDGKTMIVRSVLRKYGFVVAQITEEFKKE